MDTVDGVKWKKEMQDYKNRPEIFRDAALMKPPDYEIKSSSTNDHEDLKQKDGETSNQDKKEGHRLKEVEDKNAAELKEIPIYNTRALSKYAKTYQLETFQKNAMIIFNHENLEGYSKRVGTKDDVQALKATFLRFNFEIEEHPDCSKVDLFRELKNFSERDFTNYGCIAVVVLTHGTGNGLLRARDEGQFYSELDIVNQFKVRSKPTLVTKPVIVLIQACRGTNKASTEGVMVMQRWKMFRDHDDELEPYHLPLESDMLVVHSSFAGKPAFRPSNGSWFIQTLCSQINDLAQTHDLESIMTEVKKDIAINKYYMEFNDGTQEMVIHKQMPVVTSTLIRKLFLRGYKESMDETMDDSVPDASGPVLDSCICFLDHFDYMKKCLGHYVKDHQKDIIAKNLLNLANLESGRNENRAKAMLVAISMYLRKHCINYKYHKFMYFYDEESNLDSIENWDQNENSSPNVLNKLTTGWAKFSQSNIVRGIGTCIGAYVIFSFMKK